MTGIKVLGIGSPVTVGPLNNINAKVLGVMLTGEDCVEYKCAWWDSDGQHTVLWLSSHEVDPDEKAKYFQITNKN